MAESNPPMAAHPRGTCAQVERRLFGRDPLNLIRLKPA
jgi:hypothetical protein